MSWAGKGSSPGLPSSSPSSEAFVVFAVAWATISDTLGVRSTLVVLGAAGDGLSYPGVALLPSLGLGFDAVLVLRILGGAFTIGAFSLAMTMLMDLTGGHGRNMGPAGTTIGFGAALGAVLGGQLAAVDPLGPLWAGAAILGASALLAATIPDRLPDTDLAVERIIAGIRRRPKLLVPYAFGYIDRLTAGFFALAGVAYFRYAYAIGPVVGGSMLYGVAIVAVYLAPSFPNAAGMMVAVGVCGALVSPTTMALVTDDDGARDRRRPATGAWHGRGRVQRFRQSGHAQRIRRRRWVGRRGRLSDGLSGYRGLEVGIAVLASSQVRAITRSANTSPEAEK